MPELRDVVEPNASTMPSALWFFHCDFDAIGLIRKHAARDIVPSKDYFTNFLGLRVPTKIYPPILAGREGTIEGLPLPGNWHADIAEWAAMLRAVEAAGEEFRAVELGCGWACWLNNSGIVARRLGKSIELIGVEGDEGHIEFAREVLEENGFTADEARVEHCVAAARSGTALFPIVDNPSGIWGSQPVFDASEDQITLASEAHSHHILTQKTLTEIANGRRIDLLHIDIQGSEADYLTANIEAVDELVSYLLVGTHSRVIEGQIIDLMGKRGWRLDIERPCIFRLQNGEMFLLIDGVQGWRRVKS